MSDSFQIRDAIALTAELLLTDLDVALTFLDVAQTSNEEETVRRNRGNALRAHDTVIRFLSKLSLTEKERQRIEDKLAILQARLRAIGSIK